MQAVQYSKLGLTSKVIPANPNGEYPYEVLGFVLPHEALRREFDRGRKAFRNIDVSSEKWKIEALVEWLDDFFIPFLHVHHYVEDNIIFPFYFALGIVAPERQAEDHVSLIGRMNKLQSLARQLLHVTHNSKESAKMKTLEEKVRKEFLDLVSHCEDHFNEEEEYWPPILKKYGRENWTKVERMIFQYTTSFGDSNAGDAYRNTICSICFAMGIMIGKDSIATNPRKEVDSEGNEVLPWAGTAIQQHYIDTRPFFIRKVKMKAWNQRYLQFRQLICSIGQSECDEHGNVKTSSGWVSKKNKDGKYVDRYHKPFTPIILFVMITAMFCLAAIPFFAAVSNPLRNLKYLHIKVVNYDVGPVGHAFDHFLEAVESSSNKIPTFRYEKDTAIGFDTYRRRVLDGEAWALLSVNPGASSALAAAFANGCQNAGSYNPADAITFSWDEGRNNQVATPYIGGFTKGILGKFATKFAANYISSLSQTDISDCIANGHSQLLVSPITFTEDNMTPVSVSYVVSSAGITVGNILMAVFGAMFILNATYGATAALAEDYSPKGKVILRLFTMALVGFGVSISYATVMVGLTHNGSSEYLYTGYDWAQVFAIQWLHIMIWTFGMGCVYEGLGPGLVPLFFVLLLIYNITGGWNIDVADQGFKHFFQIFPFHWVIYILRYAFYNSLGFRRRISGGILISYWILCFTSYLYLGIKNETKFQIDKQVVIEEQLVLTNQAHASDVVPAPSQKKDEHATAVKSVSSSGHVIYHVVKDADETEEAPVSSNQLDDNNTDTNVANV